MNRITKFGKKMAGSDIVNYVYEALVRRSNEVVQENLKPWDLEKKGKIFPPCDFTLLIMSS